MHELYSLLSGPLVWAAIVIFAGGMLFRLLSMAILAWKKDRVVYEYMSARYALRSILRWLTPFSAVNMRKKPVMTVATFLFHLCAVIAPVFLYAHMILFKEAWGVGWWSIPDAVADVMTMVVIVACIFFLVRRLKLREVRYLTSASDYGLLLAVAAPFITGLWAFHQLPGAAAATLLHMFSGEILLALIPFTRLSHMFFFPFTRGYIGSEFGAVRFAKDW